MSKILVVEDDKIYLNMVAKLLINHGYEVVTAMDGKKGLEMMAKETPDLLIADIKMPVMDGFQMLSEARKTEYGKNLPVIILTAFNTDDEMLQKIVANEPAYYLVKASNRPEEILEKVDEVLK